MPVGRGGGGGSVTDVSLRAAMRRLGLVLRNDDGNLPFPAVDGSDDASLGIQHGRGFDVLIDPHPGHSADADWTELAEGTNIAQYWARYAELNWRGIHSRGAEVSNPENDDCYSNPNGHFFSYIQGPGVGGIVGWWPIDRPDLWVSGGPFQSEELATAHASGNGQITIYGNELRVSSNYDAPEAAYVRRSWEVSDPSPPYPTAYYFGFGAMELTPAGYPYDPQNAGVRARVRYAADGPHRTLRNWTFGDIFVAPEDVSVNADGVSTTVNPDLRTVTGLVLQPPAGLWDFFSPLRSQGPEVAGQYVFKEIMAGTDDEVRRSGITYGTSTAGGAGAQALLFVDDLEVDGNQQFYFEYIGALLLNMSSYLKAIKKR